VRAAPAGTGRGNPTVTAGALVCPNCTADRLTAVHIRLAPDEDHTFASCQICEWKGWSKQGGEVPLGKVLALASERRL
jgi:hypothetical protein